MTTQSRRTFLARTGACLAGIMGGVLLPRPGMGADANPPRMTLNLTPGSIGVGGGQREWMALAARHGFTAVEPQAGFLANLTNDALAQLQDELKRLGLVWGATGLPVEFRKGKDEFRQSLSDLPRLMAGLQRAGADRVGTWLRPCHGELTYVQNLRQHTQRLREVAGILDDHGQRLGLEYVGTFTSRISQKFPFIHTLAETRELIAEMGTVNVGVVLDSWHWWQAGDTAEEIRSLRHQDVVSVDLNDAPAGLPKEQQKDGERELPATTGVIDVASFLGALRAIGYDGPVRPEPFNRELNRMDDEAACAVVAAAMKKAMATVITDR